MSPEDIISAYDAMVTRAVDIVIVWGDSGTARLVIDDTEAWVRSTSCGMEYGDCVTEHESSDRFPAFLLTCTEAELKEWKTARDAHRKREAEASRKAASALQKRRELQMLAELKAKYEQT
jgi:hypothetical protein